MKKLELKTVQLKEYEQRTQQLEKDLEQVKVSYAEQRKASQEEEYTREELEQAVINLQEKCQ